MSWFCLVLCLNNTANSKFSLSLLSSPKYKFLEVEKAAWEKTQYLAHSKQVCITITWYSYYKHLGCKHLFLHSFINIVLTFKLDFMPYSYVLYVQGVIKVSIIFYCINFLIHLYQFYCERLKTKIPYYYILNSSIFANKSWTIITWVNTKCV